MLFSLFQTQLIDPAVKGTLNVLKSCAKSPSVKRVIITSSIASVVYNGRPRTPEVVVDETWFSNLDFLREQKVLYICVIHFLSIGSSYALDANQMKKETICIMFGILKVIAAYL